MTSSCYNEAVICTNYGFITTRRLCTNYGFIIYTQVRMTTLYWYVDYECTVILTSSCYDEAVICT